MSDAPNPNWTGYWGKRGPELLDRRLALYGEEHRTLDGDIQELVYRPTLHV